MTGNDSKIVLGLDIGTSSVKSSIVAIGQHDSFAILTRATASYDSKRIRKATSSTKFSQQNVLEIFDKIEAVLEQLDSDCLRKVELVAICGQMHGCVLWKDSIEECDDDAFSDQYDWTDGRCDEQFLRSLPTPHSYADRISSGFGCATLFWLSKNQPDYLRQFRHSGTIMDLLVALLCGTNQAKISAHNAHSWGYFDSQCLRWNVEILKEANFPVHLLPEPVPLETIVGHTASGGRFNKLPSSPIKSNIPVMVAYGDLQSMINLAFLTDNNIYNDHDCFVLNMGTSIQLCHRMDFDRRSPPTKSTQSVQSIDYFPYKPNQYLAVVAGLNGGNVLQRYARFLQEVVHLLTHIELSEQDIWNKLNLLHQNQSDHNPISNHLINQKLATDRESSSIQIKPTLFGERHDPETFASIGNIRFDNIQSLVSLSVGLCKSLLSNVFDMMMMPSMETVTSNNPIRIIGTGSVLVKNPMVQTALDQLIKESFSNLDDDGSDSIKAFIQYLDNCDADVGCALFAMQFYTSSTLVD